MSTTTGAAAVFAALGAWLLIAPPMETQLLRGSLPDLRWVALAALLLAAPRELAVPGLIVAAAGWGGGVLWRRRRAARLASENAARLAEACDLLAAELSAGRPAEAALVEAAAAWPVIRPVAAACRLGGDVPAALVEAAELPGAGGLRLLGAAWSVALRTGGGLGAATSRVADAVRRDQAMRRVVHGELSSARATARLMAGLPLVALLMGSGAGADPWPILIGTSLGWTCLAGGLALGWAGLWWIEMIAREADP